MSPIQLDASRWPIVVITPSANFSDADIEAFLAQFAALMNSRAEPYASILDLRRCKDMSPTQRKRITTGMETNKEHRAKWQRGVALVFESPLMKMLLTAVLWAFKPAYEIRVFTDPAEAFAWASDQVRQTGSASKAS